MKFPKHELNINQYLDSIKNLLSDEECHIFIDTNIISQLYRLNEEARNDFYLWIESLKFFHIPNWSIHEYSKRVHSKQTGDYLSEISKTKTCHKEINNISEFIKGYIGDSMLIGTSYAGNKEELFADIDDVINRLSKISSAINNNLDNHKKNVHKEIAEKLENYSLNSNIFEIIKGLANEQNIRYDGAIPPGFKDGDKGSNSAGDLIIWKELLGYCKDNSVKKAILITRDNKADMVYTPTYQTYDGRQASTHERLHVAHESLVYEFSTVTSEDDFYIINFKTLVRVIASAYRKLALSFQIATAVEEAEDIECEDPTFNIAVTSADFGVDDTEEEEENVDEERNNIQNEIQSNDRATQPLQVNEAPLYSGTAIRDCQYNLEDGKGIVDKYITELKTYNWYKQNPAINDLIKENFNIVQDSLDNRDSFFVLGRNIIQSAEGSSGSAISFIENLSFHLNSWPKFAQKAILDGCLFEVFFDSNGNLRNYGQYKSTYINELYNDSRIWAKFDVFEFIKTEIEKKERPKMVHIVNDTDRFEFSFTFDANKITTAVCVNGEDISNTFPSSSYAITFCKKEYLSSALSGYYAIPINNIHIASTIPDGITDISYIYKPEELLF